MCTNPIHIKTKASYYLPYINKAYFNVPCGECESCRMAKQSDWQLRARFHTKDYPIVYVYTLTYREDAVPYFEDKEYNIRTMAFSHKHIKDFLDNIRKYMIRRKWITNKEMNYFIASEYGEGKHSPKDKPSTHRPHYHINFYFKDTVKFTFEQFHDLMRQFWVYPHGFIFPDIKSKDPVNDNYYKTHYPCEKEVLMKDEGGTAKYISKYVCKDIDFYKKKEITDYLDKNLKKTNPQEYEKRYWRIKRFLPKHWQSKGFGIALLDEVKKDKDYYLSGGKWKDIKDLKTYHIPQYITNKLTKINCLHNRDTSNWEQYKSELNALKKKWQKYESMTDQEIVRMRNLNKNLRKYEIEQCNTSLYNTIKLKYWNLKQEQLQQKIEDFVKNTENSYHYKTKQYLELENTKYHKINRQNLPKMLSFYITYIKGREDFSTHFWNYSQFLTTFAQNPTDEEILSLNTNYLRKKTPVGEIAEDETNYRPLQTFYNEYIKWQNDKIKDHVKKLKELQIFYSQLKQKRRNYGTI